MITRKTKPTSASSTHLLYTYLSPHPPSHHPSSHISQVSRHRILRTWPINSISNNGGATDSSLLIGMAGLDLSSAALGAPAGVWLDSVDGIALIEAELRDGPSEYVAGSKNGRASHSKRLLRSSALHHRMVSVCYMD
jgi:hypothetical protein